MAGRGARGVPDRGAEGVWSGAAAAAGTGH